MDGRPRLKSKRRKIVRILLGLILFTAVSVYVQLSFANLRYDIVTRSEPEQEDILIIDQLPSEEPTTKRVKKKKEVEYLSYAKNFSYPSFINLSYLVENAVKKDEKLIQYPPINLHPYKYLNVPVECGLPKRTNATKRILVLVKSYVGNIELRVANRALWRNVTDPYMAHFFMLGLYPTQDTGRKWPIERENRIYKDIIQENFADAYFNNTIKTIMGYNWAVNFCPQADILFFHDDDYHVKYNDLALHIRKVLETNVSNIYSGSLAENAQPYRVGGERWFLTYQQYPFDVFPPYIGGGAYIVSVDVARKFHLAFPHVKYMGIDDVYLGIVARKIGIPATNDLTMSNLHPDALAKECSHNADEVFKGFCPLAAKRQEVLKNREDMSSEEDLDSDEFESSNASTPYISFNTSFSYPLVANILAAVNGKVIHNYKISLLNINAHPFLYVYQPSSCNFNTKNKNIVIFIKSYIKNVKQRAVIRNSWKEHIGNSSTTVKVIFLVAQGIHEEDQFPVDEEANKNGDILQENFREHYKNNTYKIIMALNWIFTSKKCPNSNILVFLDDDYYVRHDALLKYLQKLVKSESIFGGRLMTNQIPCRIKDDKRALSYKQYPFDKLPAFVSGGAFVISYYVARKFQLSFPYIKYLPIDDVYLGIVAHKLKIEPKHYSVFDSRSYSALVYECSHVDSKLQKGICPLAGRPLSSPPIKRIKVREGFLKRLKGLPRILMSLFKKLYNF